MPEPTAIRAARLSATTATTATKAALQIRAMRLLQGLPRQCIVTDTPLLLSWRDGVAPCQCEAVSSNGELVWRGDSASASAGAKSRQACHKPRKSWSGTPAAALQAGISAQWLGATCRSRTGLWATLADCPGPTAPLGLGNCGKPLIQAGVSRRWPC